MGKSFTVLLNMNNIGYCVLKLKPFTVKYKSMGAMNVFSPETFQYVPFKEAFQ